MVRAGQGSWRRRLCSRASGTSTPGPLGNAQQTQPPFFSVQCVCSWRSAGLPGDPYPSHGPSPPLPPHARAARHFLLELLQPRPLADRPLTVCWQHSQGSFAWRPTSAGPACSAYGRSLPPTRAHMHPPAGHTVMHRRILPHSPGPCRASHPPPGSWWRSGAAPGVQRPGAPRAAPRRGSSRCAPPGRSSCGGRRAGPRRRRCTCAGGGGRARAGGAALRQLPCNGARPKPCLARAHPLSLEAGESCLGRAEAGTACKACKAHRVLAMVLISVCCVCIRGRHL